MKITFLIPPSVEKKAPDRNFGCNYGITFQQPIHILYPAAVLEKEGYEVEFVDCPVEKRDKEWCEEFIKNDKTNVFVFFTVYLAQKTDLYWTKRIQKYRPNAKIIFFGPEPTLRPEGFLQIKNTFVIRGEIEKTILQLIKELEKNKPNYEKVLGLSWKKNKKIINNPSRPLLSNEELDELPFPARHLVKNPMKYFNFKLKGRPTTTMLTTRACWGRCTYCIPCACSFTREIEWKKSFGRKPPVRALFPQSIFEEFKLIKKQGYKSVAIMDDNFMGLKTPEHKKRIIKICQLIKPLRMEWGCLARADQLQDEEILKLMKEAGCVYVDIGVESFNQKVLDYVKKDTKVGEQINAIFLLQKIGIEPSINILLGASPFQTEDDIKWTVEILKKLDTNFPSFGIVIPHPGTEFYKIVKKNRWFATRSKDFEPVDPYKTGTVNFPSMNHKRLEELIDWCYKSYYFRFGYVIKRLRSISSFRELIENAKIFWNFFVKRG